MNIIRQRHVDLPVRLRPVLIHPLIVATELLLVLAFQVSRFGRDAVAPAEGLAELRRLALPGDQLELPEVRCSVLALSVPVVPLSAVVVGGSGGADISIGGRPLCVAGRFVRRPVLALACDAC